METGPGDPGGIQSHGQSMHRCMHRENQSPLEVEFGERHSGQQEGLLQADALMRKDTSGARVLNEFFTSVSTVALCFQES